MCETDDAELSKEACSFDLPPGILLYYCSATLARCASRGHIRLWSEWNSPLA
ncbi:hypothetical protein Krac_1579 [Ktedonobacter racemifer DSM 44963]|uniref:Uncharacterized protein n=1 Tax=Ktedonobacter racemifer DSM 44963 TaxID=485913 RepID=D6U2H5_KTERA|nr:hypothetical protein Krac_1579 [Ktedonobacter racemifer DSM 44963]